MLKYLKDFFIPHAGNDYAPHSLQKIALCCMGILILLSFTFANIQSVIWVTSDWLVSTILPAVIVDLTNDQRSTHSLSDLQRSAVLDAAAQMKAQDMATNQYFSHYSPAGVSPWHWFSVSNYNFVHAGENLAIHFSDSDAVVDAWMNSPSHKENIVNGNFTEIGVGTAQGTYEGYQTVYVVQLFGAPARPQTAASEQIAMPTVLAATEENTVQPAGVTEDPQVAGSEEVIETINDTEIFLSSEHDPVQVTEEISDIAEKNNSNNNLRKEVVAHENGVSVYSDLISTSSGAAPAIANPIDRDISSQSTPPVFALATKPQTVLQIVYTVIALFVVCVLLLSVVIEIRRQQPVQIVYSAALMGVMGILFYAHILVTSSVVVV